MPLIRYRTGDLSGFIPEPCPCGTILKRLAWVKGRLCGQIKLGRHHWLNITELDEVLFTLPGIKNYRAVLLSDNGKDCLQITLHVGDKEGGIVSHVARKVLELVPAVRVALAERKLTIAPVCTSEDNWLTTGSIKRTIIDRRVEQICS